MDENKKREIRIYKNIFSVLSITVVVVAMVVFGVVSFLDVDATESETENRKLAEKPEFSWSALFDGSYTKDFENYYSDTFPLREMFMSFNGKISAALTQFGGKEDNVIINYDKHDSDFVGEGVELESEKHEEAEKETQPSTPQDEAIKGSILISDKRAMELFTSSPAMAKDYASLVNKVSSSMPKGVKFYSMLVPTSIELYGSSSYTTGVHSQKKVINDAYKLMNKSIIKIDAYTPLQKAKNDYIYFRTDHHWTARGAYEGYRAFCKATKQTPVDINELETGKIPDFVGSLYKASNSDILKKNPDYVEYFKTRVDVEGTVYKDSRMENGTKFFIVARAVNSDNKYLAFIGGDQPLEKIVTSNKNGKKILVIKESFGNALVPFLCDNYEEVYVVDPRKTNFDLPKFVEEAGIGEVLLINYTFAMANKTFSNALASMIK